MSEHDEVEAHARAHAARVIAGDARAREDFAPRAEVEPADLFDRLLQGPFRDFELVAHAWIGAHHVLKTKYAGPTTIVVQARWIRGLDGRWRIHDAEIARLAVEQGA